MKPGHRDNILMRLHFSDGVQADQALEILSRIPELSVAIFRGRLIPEGRSCELEITGRSSRIKEFIREMSAREASAGASTSGVA